MHINQILSYKNVRKIILLPFHASIELKDDEETATICVAIGIIGWSIWTILDRIRDEYKSYNTLKNTYLENDLAVFSNLRPIIDELINSLGLPEKYRANIAYEMAMMEYANSSKHSLHIHEQSIQKSIGVAVPLLLFLMKIKANRSCADTYIDSCIGYCKKYFYHLIAIRQLSDDVLDWENDIKTGSQTPMTEWLKTSSLKDVHKKVDCKILTHSRLAIKYAKKMTCFRSTKFLSEIIEPIIAISKEE